MDEKLEKAAGGTVVDATADLMRNLYEPKVIVIEAFDGNPQARVLCTPDGRGGIKAQPTTDFSNALLTHPKRREGTASLTDLDSLIAHVNRFKSEDSALFAEATRGERLSARLNCVFDYHQACNDERVEGMEGKPDWMRHRARYAFPFSEEWQAWHKVDGEPLDIVGFAEFLQDHLLDVMEPPVFLQPEKNGGLAPEPDKLDDKDRELAEQVAKIDGRLCGAVKLLELSRGLQVNESSKVENFSRLESGEAKLQFVTEHQDAKGKPLTVPSCFLIAIPVFEAGPAYRLLVRLRYRVRNGQVVWTLMLHRAERAFEHAFREACDRAAQETGLPLFYGTPETQGV